MFLQNFWQDYFVALIITTLPALVLLLLFFFRDKIKEPFSMVISTFAMAFIITLPLDFFIQIVDPLLLALFDNQFYYSFQAFFRAAFLEEFLKFSVLYYYVSRHHEFDEFVDGIVYGAAIGLGYAVAENMGYLYFFKTDNLTNLAYYRLQPMIVHIIFGITMGILFSKSAFQIIKNNIGIYLALFLPVFMHGIHNYSIRANEIPKLSNIFFWFAIIAILYFLSSLPSLRKIYREKPKIILSNFLFLKVSTSALLFSIALSIVFGMIN